MFGFDLIFPVTTLINSLPEKALWGPPRGIGCYINIFNLS